MRSTYLAIVVVLLSTSSLPADQGLQWHLDLESAKRAAANTNRPILVHFWSPSCAPCVKLEHDVYSRHEVKRALEATFVLARLNVDDYPATASNFGVKTIPADVILAPDGQFVTLLKCPLVADQYLAQLGQFGRSPAQLAAGAPPRSGPPGAANVPNIGAATIAPVGATQPILQSSGQAPASQVTAATVAQGAGPYNRGSMAERIERYDFRATHQQKQQPPQMQQAQYQSPGQADVQQAVAPQQQPAIGQPYDMVPALAAPQVALGGLCPVQVHRVRQFINDKTRYKATMGDPRFGVVHRGRTYLFSSPVEQQEFLRDPDRYSPALSGNDPVLFFDEGRQVDGDWNFGRFIGDRVYLFSSKQSLDKFMAENDAARNTARPNRYAEAIYQAENPVRGMYR
jgi:thiol-disulfide isomerase/thioredoxin/YHS domain-containing protein